MALMVCILLYILTSVSELENDFSHERKSVSVFYTPIKVYFFAEKKMEI